MKNLKLFMSMLLFSVFFLVFASASFANSLYPSYNDEMVHEGDPIYWVYEGGKWIEHKVVEDEIAGKFFVWYKNEAGTWIKTTEERIPAVPNANLTGQGTLGTKESFDTAIRGHKTYDQDGKVVTAHKTHGTYENNTNACASCHSTHTAQAKNLVFADTTYQTCISCHDGTLGFYNVFANGEDASAAGTFGGTHSGNMSVHLATGTTMHKAAPGGNRSAASGAWTGAFSCTSCHAAHGSYSPRLLHWNPNGMTTVKVEDGGRDLTGLQVFSVLPTATATNDAASPEYLIHRTTAGAENMVNPALGLAADTPVLVLKRKIYGSQASGRFYIRDKSPWLTSSFTGGTVTGNRDGAFANGPGIATVTSANVRRAYYVEMDLTHIEGKPSVATKHDPTKLWANITADPSTRHMSGIQMSDFCSSCHVDYLANSGSPTGVYDKNLYRHTTTRNDFTCARCHYAHGTDVDIMADAKGRKVHQLAGMAAHRVEGDAQASLNNAREYLLDVNESSALKKFTNMTSCWGCHNSSKATQLTNTFRVPDHPTTMPADPSNR